MAGVALTREAVVSRFFRKIEKTESCWLWLAGVKDAKHPYGVANLEGKKIKAHRLSWLIHNGAIPEGLHVLHKCDNPRCVNPDHLFVGTHQDNMNDRGAKGRLNPLTGDAWSEAHSGTFKPRCGEDHPFRKNPELCARGSANGIAKLTEAQVIEMRERHSQGIAGRQLGRDYGISNSTVIHVLRRDTWCHI